MGRAKFADGMGAERDWLKTLELPSGTRAHLTSLIQQHLSLAENVKAMVYLSELGDLDRFPNRRTVKAYIGLAPTSHESGEVKNRKGHIKRTGPSRLRAILNQAVWARLTHDNAERKWFEGYVATHLFRKDLTSFYIAAGYSTHLRITPNAAHSRGKRRLRG